MPNDVVLTLDMDGTLVAHGNKIIGGERTIALLSALQQQGCKIIVNTGRLDHDIIAIQNQYHIQIDARVSQNGCVVIDDHSAQARLLNKQEALMVWQFLKPLTSVRTEINTISNRYWKTPRSPSFPKEYYDSHVMVDHFTPVLTYQPVTEFLCVGQTADLNEVRDYVTSHCQLLDAIMTSPSSLEIFPKGLSKGEVLRQLYPSSLIYGIGDSENDFSVFAVSEKSFFVGDHQEDRDGVTLVPTIDVALADIQDEVM
ncbi:HAD family phosphatase [Schleiferilactobacillus harbinensis]|uniref:HAD-IIB family hydrolase n=1 Tax=Schleiferilactobacillus harbinensis TaxID=304207 RepID=UPI001AAE8E67|nr:HAD family phosphatase [Schleiferilactobacillus harbinensis]